MPSKIVDQQGLSSSSYFSDEGRFPSEVGFWRQEIATGNYGSGEVTSHSSTLWKPYRHDLVGRPDFGTRSIPNAVEGDRINMMDAQCENGLFSHSFSDLVTRKLKLSDSTVLLGHSVDTIARHDEEEPFESSEEIEAQTIGNLLPNDDDLLSGVADGFDHAMQPGGANEVEDLDFFISVGGMDLGDDSSCVGLRSSEDHVGGCSGSVAAEHPFGEYPSRTLFVRNINSNVEDSELRALFERYGDIRTLYTACKHRGFVMISYYDLRAAQNAMRALQSKPLRRRKLDIHFSIPKENPPEKDVNLGTLIAFNLDSSISNDEIHQIFGVYGEIKEICEGPHKSQQKFIVFYDIRAAESALRALNWRDIAGKQIKLEHCHPGAPKCLNLQDPSEPVQNDSGVYLWPNSSDNNTTTGISGLASHGTHSSSSMDNETILGVHPAARVPVTPFQENSFHRDSSSNVPDSLSSAVRADPASSHPGVAEPSQSQSHMKFDFQGTPLFHAHSFPDYYDGATNGVPCKSVGNIFPNTVQRPSERIENGEMCRGKSKSHLVELNEGVFSISVNGNCPLTRHQHMLNNIHHPQPQGMMWPNSPSYVNGVCAPPRVHGIPSSQPHMLRTVATVSNPHVGSAPAVNPSIWERQHAFAPESPEASGFLPGSLGSLRINPVHHPLEFGPPPNLFPHIGGNCVDLQIPSKNVGLHSHHHQACLMFPGRCQMMPLVNSFEPPNDRARSRRNESNSGHADSKKQYELDIDRIVRGEDSRTTLMIKNIPNKYTSKMLLATIDERHRGTYDFIYLPIDFKNKCNVGYAFINMTDPSQIIPFYQEFNGKKWEKFNSEKVASLAYARIQGKAALIAHFQNSSLMNEDKRCRPILFNTDGPNAGDQVPFPMGVHIRSRPGKSRTGSTENHVLNPENREGSSSGESGMGSGKELD